MYSKNKKLLQQKKKLSELSLIHLSQHRHLLLGPSGQVLENILEEVVLRVV